MRRRRKSEVLKENGEEKQPVAAAEYYRCQWSELTPLLL
jgi:hypothetical protein